MQNKGFVKLYRRLLDSQVKNLGVVGIGFMSYCLLRANHKDGQWFDGSRFIDVKRGQFVSSSIELAKELKLGRQTIRTTIKKFEELGILTSQPTNRYTLITLVNYSKYQDYQALVNQQTNQQLTSSQPTHQPANQPQLKNIKKEKKNNITLHRQGRPNSNQKNKGEPSNQGEPSSNRNPDIKRFIDFFCQACHKIREQKPLITRGKDGRLVKLALRKLSVSQLEQLAVWFLEKKTKLSPTIGAMLSKAVLIDLQQAMRQPDFWQEVNAIYDKYYSPANSYNQKLAEKFQAFTHQQITQMQEEVSAQIRPSGLYH